MILEERRFHRCNCSRWAEERGYACSCMRALQAFFIYESSGEVTLWPYVRTWM